MVSSAKSQISINLAFAFLKALSLVVSLRVADAVLSAHFLGVILLLRRQAALWANLIQLGLSQSVKRFYIKEPDPEIRNRTWIRQVRVGILFGFAVFALGLFFLEDLSALLLGVPSETLGLGFVFLTIGISIGYLATSSWLAEMKFLQANSLEWLTGSLIFIFCLGMAPFIEEPSIAVLLGASVLTVSILSLSQFKKRFIALRIRQVRPFHLEPTILSYSISRCMTAFFEMGIFVAGPWLMRENPVTAGHLILAYTFMKIAQMLVNPIAKVLALRAGSHQLNSKHEEQNVTYFAIISFIFSWLIVGAYLIADPSLFALWLPRSWPEVTEILDTLIYFVPAISIFYCLRSHIEIKYHFPWNLVTLFAACSVLPLYFHYQGGNAEEMVQASAAMFSVFYIYGFCYFAIIYLSRSQNGGNHRKLDHLKKV